jgi:hypothetical protein
MVFADIAQHTILSYIELALNITLPASADVDLVVAPFLTSPTIRMLEHPNILSLTHQTQLSNMINTRRAIYKKKTICSLSFVSIEHLLQFLVYIQSRSTCRHVDVRNVQANVANLGWIRIHIVLALLTHTHTHTRQKQKKNTFCVLYLSIISCVVIVLEL